MSQGTKLLFAIVLTIPISNYAIGGNPYLRVAFALIYLYVPVSILGLLGGRSRHHVRRALKVAWPVWGVWAVMLVQALLFRSPIRNDTAANSIVRQFLFYSVFFTFALIDVERLSERGRTLVVPFAFAVVGMVLAFFGGFSREHGIEGRVSLIGLNPNVVAVYCATAFLIFADALINKQGLGAVKRVRRMAPVLLVLLLVIIGASGSRGGVVMLTSSLGVYALTSRNLPTRSRQALIVVGVLGAIALGLIMTSDVMSNRLDNLEDDMRITVLWPTGFDMILESPVFGAGPGEFEGRMVERTGRPFAPHNEYLKVGTSAGLVGLALFGYMLLMLVRNARAWQRMTGSGLHLALWTLTVLFLFQKGGALTAPFAWVLFLMMAQPPFQLASQRYRRFLVFAPQPQPQAAGGSAAVAEVAGGPP